MSGSLDFSCVAWILYVMHSLTLRVGIPTLKGKGKKGIQILFKQEVGPNFSVPLMQGKVLLLEEYLFRN